MPSFSRKFLQFSAPTLPLPESTPEEERGGPRHSPLGTHNLHMGFPIGSKVKKTCSDTKRTKEFWVRIKTIQNRGRGDFAEQRAEKKIRGHEEKPRNVRRRKQGGLTQSKSQGVFLTPCCPTPWPAPFGRSPEDAVSAARERSGALGSKASGGALRAKTGRGSPGRPPPPD